MTIIVLGEETYAQKRGGGKFKNKGNGSISGRVVVNSTNKPLAYATVYVYTVEDSSLVSGGKSKSDGVFKIESLGYGKYYICIKFIGFEKKSYNHIHLSSGSPNADLGDIHLDEDASMKDEVVVEAKKRAVEYKIDRKVVNVDKNLAASSGTAVEVLQDVPSIQVDIEGNVQLRGSSGFIVMIDGKPSILEPSDALRQIPASAIENIEIITNPSAKFDPDGATGIVNIVMKKQKYQGTSGLMSFDIGQYNKLGGNILLNYKNDFYNFFIGADYRGGDRPGTSINRNETTVDDLEKFIYSEGDRNWNRTHYGVRAGLDLDLSDNDKLTFQARYGAREMESTNQLAYSEWTSLEPEKNYYNSDQYWKRGGDNYSLSLDYIRTFGKMHNLTAQFDYRKNNGDEESKDEMFDFDNIMTFGAFNTEDGPSQRLKTKIDYTLPIGEDFKYEAGYQSRIGVSEDITGTYDYDFDNHEYFLLEEYSHSIEYRRNIHSLYTMFSGMVDDFGFQGGLRGEYTDRKITLRGEDETFTIDRWDLFPTLHFSYKFNEDLQVITSYTKRIDRPRGWHLEPFITKSDAFNLRQGNPDLKPEYIDSYELGLLKYVGSNSLSLEGFYRRTVNKIERIKTLVEGEDDLFMNTTDNVGTDYSLGAEIMFDYQLFEFWETLLSGSAYQYKIESVIQGKEKNLESFNWNSRWKNTFQVFKTTTFEFTLRYNSASVSSQGTREGFLEAGLAIRQDLFEKKFSATLQIRDLFASRNHEHTTTGDSYYIYSYFEGEAPVLALTLKYNFNNFKQKRRSGGGDDDGGEGFE